MMTKEESRKLLQKIENLLGQAEPDGYIDLAFKGCVGLAHENIDNDWGCSPMDWKEGVYDRDRQLEELRAFKDSWQEKYQKEHDRVIRQADEIDKWIKDYHKLEVKSEHLDHEVLLLKDEIIQLKAKLYDMMVERKS